MHTSFKIKEAFSFSWNRFKANWRVLSGTIAGAYLVNIIVSTLSRSAQHDIATISLWSIVSVILGVMVAYAVTKIGLLEGKGVKVVWKDIFTRDLVIYLEIFALTVLVGVVLAFAVVAAMGAGIVFSVSVPYDVSIAISVILGLMAIVYLSVVTKFAIYALVDGSDIVGSLKRGFNLVKGSFWKIVGLFVVLVGMNIVGAVALVIGLLVTIPMSIVIMGYVYHKLVEAHTHHTHHSHTHETHDSVKESVAPKEE